MNTSRRLRLLPSFLLIIFLAGCAAKKSAGPTLPPQQAPQSTPTPEATPQPTPTPAQQSQSSSQGTPPPEPETAQPAAKNDKKTANNKQRINGKKSSTQSGGTRETARNSPPSKIVVRPDAEPPASGGQISPAGNNDAARGEPSTDQLLQSTENNLNNLKPPLSSDEQATVTQIRDFINQSRQATKENDGIRAHNLALKAHLLCDDLVKRH